MNRRGFLGLLGGAAAALVAGLRPPEIEKTWVTGSCHFGKTVHSRNLAGRLWYEHEFVPSQWAVGIEIDEDAIYDHKLEEHLRLHREYLRRAMDTTFENLVTNNSFTGGEL